jgi:hypothetical protein
MYALLINVNFIDMSSSASEKCLYRSEHSVNSITMHALLNVKNI